MYQHTKSISLKWSGSIKWISSVQLKQDAIAIDLADYFEREYYKSMEQR